MCLSSTCAKRGVNAVQDARELLQAMAAGGAQLTATCWNTVLRGYAERGRDGRTVGRTAAIKESTGPGGAQRAPALPAPSACGPVAENLFMCHRAACSHPGPLACPDRHASRTPPCSSAS